MSRKNRGEAICETVRELKFRERIRKLAEEREKSMAHKKKEACADGYAQASIKKLTLDNDITKMEECQDGGVFCDD